MIVYRTLREARADKGRWGPAVTTVGFFDGLHKGHQKLLDDLKLWSSEVGGAPVVITFDRHPQLVISGSAPAAVLSTRHRLLLLRREGIETVLLLPFDRELSHWSPEKFVGEVLHRSLDSRHLLLGFDGAIGHKRVGNYEYLSRKSNQLEITVRESAPFLLDGLRVSSTLVREAIIAGDLQAVRTLTGRPYAVLGQVVGGDKRGKELGFPTANLAVDVEASLPSGVYFADATHIETAHRQGYPERGGRPEGRLLGSRPALVNIGRRPTFAAPASGVTNGDERLQPGRDQIEAHILDYENDLYGDILELRFWRYHRSERRFGDAKELVAQIHKDESAIRKWLPSSELLR